MARYFYIYSFAVVFLFVSCNTKENKYLAANIEVENEELKGSILEYDSIIHSDPKFLDGASNGNYLLTVYEQNINDSVTRYSISFSLDTWLMEDEPIWLAVIGGKHVVFYPSNTYKGILSTDKQLHKAIACRYFPEEYKLLVKGKPLESFVINDTPSMMLTFVKGKLVTKKMSKDI